MRLLGAKLVPILGCLSLGLPVVAQEELDVPPEYEPLHGLLIGQKVEADKAKSFVDSVVLLDLEGDSRALNPFLEEEGDFLPMLAGALLAFADPNRAFKRTRMLLKKERGLVRTHLFTLSLIPRKRAVDLLLDQWSRTENEEEVRIIGLGLRAQTKQDLKGREDWTRWWEENRKGATLAKVRTLDDLFSRIQVAANLTLGAEVRKAFAGLDGELGEEISGIFDGIAALNELGTERENKFAEAGDALFRVGRFEEAQESYLQALKKFPEDLKSPFLWACLEMEAGRWASAREKLEKVAMHERAHFARYLVAWCKAMEAKPREGLLEVALKVMLQMPEEMFSDYLTDDIVMARVMGQAMAKRGVLQISLERLSEIQVEYPEDLEVQIGVALRMGYQQRQIQIEGVLARFPGAPLALSQTTRAQKLTLRWDEDGRKLNAESAALYRRWIEVDPENLTAHVGSILREHLEEDPADKFQNPRMSEEGWGKLLEKLAALKANDWEETAVKAQRRVSELAGHPFPWRIDGSSAPPEILLLSQVARKRIELLSKEGREKEIERTFRATEKLFDLTNARTFMQYVIQLGAQSSVLNARAKFLMENGREEEAKPVDAKVRELRQSKERMMESMRYVGPLELLPIPSLQDELGPLYRLEPAKLIKMLSTKVGESPSR